MTHPKNPFIRPAEVTDLETLLALNNASVPAVNELTLHQLEDLVNAARICLVAEVDSKPCGFLLCLVDGESYNSRNYRWLSQRRQRFAYTDRICVAETARGRKIGEFLYGALFEIHDGSDRTFVCEVNERPPNPGSLRFHKRLGFSEIGRQDHGDTAVIFLERSNG